MTSHRTVTRDIAQRIVEQGYRQLPGGAFGAAAVWFVRRPGFDLIVTLGLEFSRHYDDRFTAAFYAAPFFQWGYVVPGFPPDAYQRIGHLLTDPERAELLPVEFSGPAMRDAWWIGFGDDTLTAFLQAVAIAESRFTSQAELVTRVQSSEGVRRHMSLIQLTRTYRAHPIESQVLAAQPRRPSRDVSPEWYEAAEMALTRTSPGVVTREYVALLAIDAWRCETLE